MSTSVPTIILTWECKKDLADIKKFISSWLKFISSELIDLIGDFDWQFIDLKADKSNLPINCCDCFIIFSVSIFLCTHQTLFCSNVIGDLLFKILYSYHLNFAENLELKSLSTSSACKIDMGWGLR